MKVNFWKYQGTGNDFIMLDNRSGKIDLHHDQIVKLCDRKFGIGSDGIILLEETGFADFYMNFYNPDGSQSFCGNGSRCTVKFAQLLGVDGPKGEFKAIDGNHAFSTERDVIKIHMRNVLGIERDFEHFIIHTGSPHYIIYVDDVDKVDLIHEAHKIRYNQRFSDQGINVNFVSVVNGILHMRTYERGVEDETLSCGTGVTAAALSYAYSHTETHSVKVVTRGGVLEVQLSHMGNGHFEDIWLCGPAEFVFQGEITI